MMKWLISISLVCVLLGVFGGCGIPVKPSQEDLANADFGVYPHNYQEIIESYLSQRLFDPYSAQYQWDKPEKYRLSGLGGKKFGYRVYVEINAKNRFGGYVGARPRAFMIRNGVIIWDSAEDF